MIYVNKSSDHKILHYDSRGMNYIEIQENTVSVIPINRADFQKGGDTPLSLAVNRAKEGKSKIYLPLAQHEFLLATAPDVYVLCINLSDNVDYIKRTILYLESLYGAKVLALAALPFDHAQKWSVISNKKIKLSNDEIRNRVDKIKQETLLDVFIISDELDVVNLAERIVDFFS